MNTVANLLTENLESVFKRYSALFAYLFGSQAKGKTDNLENYFLALIFAVYQ